MLPRVWYTSCMPDFLFTTKLNLALPCTKKYVYYFRKRLNNRLKTKTVKKMNSTRSIILFGIIALFVSCTGNQKEAQSNTPKDDSDIVIQTHNNVNPVQQDSAKSYMDNTIKPTIWTVPAGIDSATRLKPNRKKVEWHLKNGSAKNLDILQELKTRFANRDTNAIADRIAVIRYLIAAPGRGDIASKRYCHEYLTALWEVNYHRIRIGADKSLIVRYLNGDKKAISQPIKLMVIYAWLFNKIEYYSPEHAAMYDYATQEMITDLNSEPKSEDVEFVLRALLTFMDKGF